MDDSPGPEHAAFTQWAVSHGIKINGVAPAHFPGRRLGMVATRVVEENEIMLFIPVNLMLAIDSIPKEFVSLFPEGTPVQGILAAFLMHGDKKALAEMSTWRSVWPSWEEFQHSMPIFWPGRSRVSKLPGDNREVQDGIRQNDQNGMSETNSIPLPPSISGAWGTTSHPNSPKSYETRYQSLLPQQTARFEHAWAGVTTAFPSKETDFTIFAHNWAIINSRSFYYISPGKDEPEDWNDAIAMVPYADYFNHGDNVACEAVFDGEWYTFKATRRYEKGEEIFMNYGEHSNDFLWVEYGFYLDSNPSDCIYLDDVILPTLSKSEKKDLIEQGCFGNYELTASDVNTSVINTASMKYMSRQQWRDYVNDVSEEGFDGKKTAGVIRGWVEAYLRECDAALDALNGLSKSITTDSDKEKLELIVARWEQIKQLCEGAIKNTTA